MSDYVKFSAKVSWFNYREKERAERPLTGLLTKIYYHRRDDYKLLKEDYLSSDGLITVSVKKTKKLIFDKDTEFITEIYSKTEYCKVFWRKRVGSRRNYSVLNFSTKYSGELTRGEMAFNFDADDIRKRIFIAHLFNLAGKFILCNYNYNKIPKADCIYPYTEKSTPTSNAGSGMIRIIECDWSRVLFVVFHEYAHILQDKAWPASQNDSGMQHNDGMDFTVNTSKERGMNAAFVEAFADYFANRVYDVNKNLFGRITLGDQFEHMDTQKDVDGEANERSIASFLYDLTDSLSEERSQAKIPSDDLMWQAPLDPFDRIRYSDEELFDVIRKLKKINLFYLVGSLCSRHPEDKESMKLLLTMNGIAPHNIRTSRIVEEYDLFEVNWEPGGAKRSIWLDKNAEKTKEMGFCKTNQDECTVYLSSIDNPGKVLDKSGVLKDERYYGFKYSMVKPYFDRGDNAVVIKVKGKCTEKEVTEYESCYCLAGFQSYLDGDKFVLLPDIINCDKDEYRYGRVRVSTGAMDTRVDGKYNFRMENGSYFRLNFTRFTFNDVWLEFDGNCDGSCFEICVSDQRDLSMQKYYSDLAGSTPLIRLKRSAFPNLDFDASFVRINYKGNPDKPQILKRVILSTKKNPAQFGNIHVPYESGDSEIGKNLRDLLESSKKEEYKIPPKKQPKKK